MDENLQKPQHEDGNATAFNRQKLAELSRQADAFIADFTTHARIAMHDILAFFDSPKEHVDVERTRKQIQDAVHGMAKSMIGRILNQLLEKKL
jgi:hypothetical protein